MSYAPVSRIVAAPSPGSAGTTCTVEEDTGDRFPAVPFDYLIWPGQERAIVGDNAEEGKVLSIVGDDFVLQRATSVADRIDVKAGYEIAAVRSMTSYDIDEVVSLEHTFSLSNPPYHIHTRSPLGAAGSASAVDAGAGKATYSFDPDKPGVWHYRFAGVSEEGPDEDFFVRFSSVL
jgi:hypothetical protein